MKERWTTNPETGTENSSPAFLLMQEAIEEILSKQLPGANPKDLKPTAFMVLTNLAAKYQMVPIELLTM